MKTAVVCGAGGFIGSHLVKRLKTEGYWVRGVDIKKPEFSPSAADEFLVQDLREEANCRAAVALGFDLVAEVVSLGSRHRDRLEKRDLYEQPGVQDYWIIDPEAASVDVLSLEHGTYQLVMHSAAGQTAASRMLPGFVISMDDLGCVTVQ
jgi:Uma2 family endonuclease